MTTSVGYSFFAQAARILNTGQSRSVLLHGNVQDLFYAPDDASGDSRGRSGYVPLIEYLSRKCQVQGLILLVYEINGPVRFVNPGDKDRLLRAWVQWKSGQSFDELVFQATGDTARRVQLEQLRSAFNSHLHDSIGQPTLALEFLRQLTLCSRSEAEGGGPVLAENLLIVIEAADMLMPAGDGDVARLAGPDRHRIGIGQDWFCDPGFMNGGDSVLLLAESRSGVHPRVTQLPQVLAVEVEAPDRHAREHYIRWACAAGAEALGHEPPQLEIEPAELAQATAGLTIHALRQLLLGSQYGEPVGHAHAVARVEQHVMQQLGEDVVEFKRPTHRLDDVVGFSRLKAFFRSELIPRLRSSGDDALPGAAVAGPIGSGKTFVFEALAAELQMPVLVLKNLRSQYFGQTDVIFERFRRVLLALGKVMIFVDEADTQFGGVGENAHETERRLTGRIQQMMSDPALRGRVTWLLMTARIHLLSPDIRRPGRVGDLIIPVLDPQGDDRDAFIRWALRPAVGDDVTDELVRLVAGEPMLCSAASYAALRSTLKARRATTNAALTAEEVAAVVHDQLPAAIEDTRRYQTLQALINCTRRSLLPNPDATEADRRQWQAELAQLEARAVR